MRRARVAGVAGLMGMVIVAAGVSGARCYYDVQDQVVNGTWGGEHMSIVVSDTGAGAGGAAIEFDCAAGAIPGSLRTDSNGDFTWNGFFYPGHGGPSRIDEKPDPHVAVYSGHVDGDAMAVTLRVADSLNITQQFTLTKGGNPKVFKCY